MTRRASGVKLAACLVAGIGVSLAALAVAVAASTAPGVTRDWRHWPFSQTSPWNSAIGADARYVAVPGLDSLPAGLNYADRWTSAVVISTNADPLVHVLVNRSWPTTNWQALAKGTPNCGISPEEDARLRNDVAAEGRHAKANPWSTTSPGKEWAPPAAYHPADADTGVLVHLKPGACPSPDTDGLMADFQPDGRVLDTYATIILRNGDVLSDRLASFVDARGDGTGWWNGRRASMFPSFAGLIRTGEIASGRIPHALALVMTSRMLARKAVWPASAFDRDSKSYAGPLPMGALLAIPASVDLATLGLSPSGMVLARAAQDYGAYIVDSTDGSGLTFNAELNNPDIRWPGWQGDVDKIAHQLQQLANNSAEHPGGGGVPRAEPAPPFAAP